MASLYLERDGVRSFECFQCCEHHKWNSFHLHCIGEWGHLYQRQVSKNLVKQIQNYPQCEIPLKGTLKISWFNFIIWLILPVNTCNLTWLHASTNYHYWVGGVCFCLPVSSDNVITSLLHPVAVLCINCT